MARKKKEELIEEPVEEVAEEAAPEPQGIEALNPALSRQEFDALVRKVNELVEHANA